MRGNHRSLLGTGVLLWSRCLCCRVLLLLCHSRRGAFIWPACAHTQYQSGCSQHQFNICSLLFSDSKSSPMSPCHFGTCLACVGLQWLVLYRGSAHSAVYRMHLWWISRPSNKGMLEDNERVWGAWDAKEARSRGIGGGGVGGAPLLSTSLLVFFFFFCAINLAWSLEVRVWQEGMSILMLDFLRRALTAKITASSDTLGRTIKVPHWSGKSLSRRQSCSTGGIWGEIFLSFSHPKKSRRWKRLLMWGKITSCIMDFSSLLYM